MKAEFISKEEARQFLVSYHNLNGSQNYSGSVGVLQYFNKVGSIQYDPLNVVGRNADLVLQSKISNYKPELLQNLLYQEHTLVDGFDKEMCIYSSKDFSKFKRIREASGISAKNTLTYRNQLDALDILDEVRALIAKNGAIGSKDINIGESIESRWGHKKLSSAALDYLYTIGELCVVNKNGTQKLYDFTSNVLPSQNNENDSFKNDDEFLCWYIKRRIGSMGIVWDKKGGAWQGHFLSDNKTRNHILNMLLEKGEILQFNVENIKNSFYVRKEDLSYLVKTTQSTQVRFLAPLDNMLWDRDMISQLFGFDYRWEVYTPALKRKYGYYVLPVLYGNKLIARFEAEKVAKNAPFKINKWWWEPDVNTTTDLQDVINIAIQDFSKYLNVGYSPSYFI